MVVEEWKKANNFKSSRHSCGGCKYCKYNDGLHIMFCEKMHYETNADISDCEVDFEDTFCKVLFIGDGEGGD